MRSLGVQNLTGAGAGAVVVDAVLHDVIAAMAEFAPGSTDSYGRQVSVIMRLQQLMLEDADFI